MRIGSEGNDYWLMYRYGFLRCGAKNLVAIQRLLSYYLSVESNMDIPVKMPRGQSGNPGLRLLENIT